MPKPVPKPEPEPETAEAETAEAETVDRPRSIALRHPGGQVVRCLPAEAGEWASKGYVPVPHSGGHGNPPDPS